MVIEKLVIRCERRPPICTLHETFVSSYFLLYRFISSMYRRHGRTLLLNNWNKAANEASAAAIYISSTITDAEIERHLEKFTYIERKYYL